MIDHLTPLIQAIQLNKFLRSSCFTLQLFLWEAWQDLTLVILMIAAAVSLALGIKTEVDFHSVLKFLFSHMLKTLRNIHVLRYIIAYLSKTFFVDYVFEFKLICFHLLCFLLNDN